MGISNKLLRDGLPNYILINGKYFCWAQKFEFHSNQTESNLDNYIWNLAPPAWRGSCISRGTSSGPAAARARCRSCGCRVHCQSGIPCKSCRAAANAKRSRNHLFSISHQFFVQKTIGSVGRIFQSWDGIGIT